MCGLFGWTGTDLTYFNYDKIKLLGILNDDRGGDGFGIYTGDWWYKSVVPGKFKEGLKNLEATKNLIPLEQPLYMGHTRKKSTGRIDMAHTQPIITDDKDLYSVIMHNGTIENLDTLIEEVNMSQLIPSITDLSDTQVLALILHQLKKENRDLSEVLNKYVGFAALLMYFSSDPGGIFIYKGASKWYDTSPTLTEERPLFYIKEAGKGIYISSIEESLTYLIDNNNFEKVTEVLSNTIFRVEGDNIEFIETINREKSRYGVISRKNYNAYNTEDDDVWGGYKGFREKEPNVPFNNTLVLKNTKVDSTNTFLKKDPSHEYLEGLKINLCELARDKFNGNHLPTFEFIKSSFPVNSLYNMSETNIELERLEEGAKIIFHRGRYFVLYSSKTPWAVLANGIYNTDYTGKIYYIPGNMPEQILKIGFKHGVLFSLKDPSFVSNTLREFFSSSSTVKRYIDCLVEFPKDVLYTDVSKVFDNALEPIMLLYPEGRVYSKSERGVVTPFTGTYEPIFNKYGYNIKSGYVISTFLKKRNSFIDINSLQQKEIENTIAQVLTLCPACGGDSTICDICDGEGFIEEDAYLKYMEVKNPKEDTQEDNLDPQIKSAIISEMEILCDHITEARNSLITLGVSCTLLDSLDTYLTTFEDDIAEIINNT